jgi:hypothetical protein
VPILVSTLILQRKRRIINFVGMALTSHVDQSIPFETSFVIVHKTIFPTRVETVCIPFTRRGNPESQVDSSG